MRAWRSSPTYNLCARRWVLGAWQVIQGPTMLDEQLSTGYLLLADGVTWRLRSSSSDDAIVEAESVIAGRLFDKC